MNFGRVHIRFLGKKEVSKGLADKSKNIEMTIVKVTKEPPFTTKFFVLNWAPYMPFRLIYITAGQQQVSYATR